MRVGACIWASPAIANRGRVPAGVGSWVLLSRGPGLHQLHAMSSPM